MITHIVILSVHVNFSYSIAVIASHTTTIEPLHTNMYIVSMFEYKVLETTVNQKFEVFSKYVALI